MALSVLDVVDVLLMRQDLGASRVTTLKYNRIVVKPRHVPHVRLPRRWQRPTFAGRINASASSCRGGPPEPPGLWNLR